MSMSSSLATRSNFQEENQSKCFAVIDIGATSIRLAIAEIDQSTGTIRPMATASRSVGLGHDTFKQSRIRRVSIENCVEILRSYRQLLREYGVDRSDQTRVVATSAVREAANRLSFIDRIFVATDFEIEILEEAEVNRITYMGIQPLIHRDPSLSATKAVVVEIGSGSTEVLMVRGGNVLFSSTYRLGALRLLETLARLEAPRSKYTEILSTQIQRFADQIHEQLESPQHLALIAMGSDVRFGVKHLVGELDAEGLSTVATDNLENFAIKLMKMSIDDIADQYSLSYVDAETVGPGLLSYAKLARKLGCDLIRVASTNLRDGLLRDFAARERWTAEFRNQIIRSAINLGRKFSFDEQFGRHVALLCRKLFNDLASEHQLEPRFELVVYLAALLHEIGQFVNVRSSHKHAMYLILNSDLFGLNTADKTLVALVARYHRRSSPKPSHELFSNLDRRDRVIVSKLSSILRVAIALNDSRTQRIAEIKTRLLKGRYVIDVVGAGDVSVEKLAMRQANSLFEETYGREIMLRSVKR